MSNTCIDVRKEGKDGAKYRWYVDLRCVFEHSNGLKVDAYRTDKATEVDRMTTFGLVFFQGDCPDRQWQLKKSNIIC